MSDFPTRFNVLFALRGLALGSIVAGVDIAIGRRHPTIPVAAAGAIAALIGIESSPRWAPWLVPAIVVVGVALALEVRGGRSVQVAGHPLDPITALLAVVTLIGVWSAVPDTEPAIAGAVLLLPLAATRLRWHRPVTPTAWLALVVIIGGSVWVGSAGWPSALAVVCVAGLVATAPLVAGFGAPLATSLVIRLGGAQAVVALVLPRAMMRQTPWIAWTIGLSAVAVLTALAKLQVRTTLDSAAPR